MDKRGSWVFTKPKAESIIQSVRNLGGGNGSLSSMRNLSLREEDTESITQMPYSSNPFDVFGERVVVAMVGLPARGKSYLSNSIIRYLTFMGCPAKMFNCGNLRRKEGLAGIDATYFDVDNQSAKEQRERMAMQCLDDVLLWLHESTANDNCAKQSKQCAVGILDATNTTIARRNKIIERCQREIEQRDPNLRLLFVESITNDKGLLEWNYRMKLSNKDYEGMDEQKALEDFKERVRNYEKVYESIQDSNDDEAADDNNKDAHKDNIESSLIRYIKLIDAGKKLVSRGVEGLVMRKIQHLLGSIHLGPRTIYMILVGETINDNKLTLGGNADLSKAGYEYGRAVAKFMNQKLNSQNGDANSLLKNNKVAVYTGTLKRYITMTNLLLEPSNESLECGRYQVLALGATNDICSGDLDSLTQEELQEMYPSECQARVDDKLHYRYPGVGGESYVDVATRANDIICYLEQSRGDSIVICDRAFLRCCEGYFGGKSLEELPSLEIKPGVLELRRGQEGFVTKQWSISSGKATSQMG